MSQTALESFSVTRRTNDPRADGGTRIVHLSADRILIERTVQGVKMTIAVPVPSYQGLVIALRPQAGLATLALRHEDRDLDVALASGDAIEVGRQAKAWSAVFGATIAIEDACVTILRPIARQRHRLRAARRSQFAKRRTIGRAARLATTFAGEREIIART